MSLQLLGDNRSLRRRALFSSVSHIARDAERDHAARWFAGEQIFTYVAKPTLIKKSDLSPRLQRVLSMRRAVKELSAEAHDNPAAGVSGEVPPPGQTGDGEG
jgi:hypothetical protein